MLYNFGLKRNSILGVWFELNITVYYQIYINININFYYVLIVKRLT